MCPVAAITSTVDMTEITIMAMMNSCITSHDSMSPTAGGMNINGIIVMSSLPVSFTADSLMTPVHSAVNSIVIPYMLAGIGSGIMRFSISPMKEIASIIPNWVMNFILA